MKNIEFAYNFEEKSPTNNKEMSVNVSLNYTQTTMNQSECIDKKVPPKVPKLDNELIFASSKSPVFTAKASSLRTNLLSSVLSNRQKKVVKIRIKSATNKEDVPTVKIRKEKKPKT